MKKKIITLLLMSILYISSKAQTGLQVIPARLFFSINKGETSYQKVLIKNGYDKKMQFKASITDWDVDENGALQSGKSSNRSCRNWVSFNKDLIELEAGQVGEVLVKLSIPDSNEAVENMRWCMALFENVDENKLNNQEKAKNTGLRFVFQCGVYILQTPPGLINKKDVQMLSFTSVPDKKNSYTVTCKNTGKVRLECKGHIELVSLTTGEKTSLPDELFSIYPDKTRITNFTIPDSIAKGKYSATVIVDAQDDEIPLQASEATIEVK